MSLQNVPFSKPQSAFVVVLLEAALQLVLSHDDTKCGKWDSQQVLREPWILETRKKWKKRGKKSLKLGQEDTKAPEILKIFLKLKTTQAKRIIGHSG